MTIIAAIAQNNVIGQDGKLPWYLPEDLKHFKTLTTGHVVLMGRKTWESIPEKFRPLPNRKSIVITRQAKYNVPDEVEVYHSVDDALRAYPSYEIFVIGGAEIYRQTINRVDHLEITHVDQKIDGDVFFPPIDPTMWHEIKREPHEGFTFVTYERKTRPH